MGEQLTALDATFLELEEADQSAHMHIGGVMVLEPQLDGVPPIDQIQRDVITRLPDLPRYTHRLSHPRTGGLHWPTWEEDTDFQVERHVFSAGLHAPGGRDELMEWAGEYFSQRLDRTKPLWEIAVLELSDGRWSLVTKTHHCMIDGVGSVDLATILLDTERERPERAVNGTSNSGVRLGASAEIETVTEPDPTSLQRGVARLARPALRLGHAAVSAGQSGLEAAEAAVGFASHPSRARDAFRRSKAFAELIVRDELIAAPHTSLNEPIGAKRTLSVLTVELGRAEADQARARRHSERRRTRLGRRRPPPAARAPRRGAARSGSARDGPDERARRRRSPGDGEQDHVAVRAPPGRGVRPRPSAIGSRSRRPRALKSGTQHEGSSLLLDLGNHMPPVLHSFVARSLFATRLFNVTVTNVPGPQAPLYYFGSRIDEIWPLVPIAAATRDRTRGLQLRRNALLLPQRRPRFLSRRRGALPEGIETSIVELRELAAAARRRPDVPGPDTRTWRPGGRQRSGDALGGRLRGRQACPSLPYLRL